MQLSIAEGNSLLFEGDMAFSKNQKDIVKEAIEKKIDIEKVAGKKFAATTKAFPKWTNAIVPYTFASNLGRSKSYA